VKALDPKKPAILGTPRQTAWLLLKRPPEAHPYLEGLSRRCPDFVATATVAREFARLIRERDAAACHQQLGSGLTDYWINFIAQVPITDKTRIRGIWRHCGC
jgi:hypothetical protein